MSNPQVEFRPQPKLRRFQPLLPKYFRVEDAQNETSAGKDGGKAGKNGNIASSRSAPGLQTTRERTSFMISKSLTQEDVEHKMHALHLQKSRLYQELYQMEEQHRKKNSIQARLLSIQEHLEKLKQMSVKAKEMMTRETSLLERFNHELRSFQALERPHSDLEKAENGTERHHGRMICGDVSGVMCVLEFTDKVTAHLNFTQMHCETIVPYRLETMSMKDIERRVIPHLFLQNIRGVVHLHFDSNYPSDHLTIAVCLSGYPYLLVCLDISEADEDVLIQANDGDIHLSIAVAATKLNFNTKLKLMDGSQRVRMQQTLQANLLVQQKGGVYSLVFKSYTYHLGRLVYRVLPKHGEMFSITVYPPRTQFADNPHEKQICTAHLQVRDDEAVVTLVVDTLSDRLRLHFRWKRQEVLFCEETDTDLFHFLKSLQFVSAKENPITFLKSLEMLKSIRPRVGPQTSPR